MKNLLKKALSLSLSTALMLSAVCRGAETAPLSGVALKGVYEAYNTIKIGDLEGRDLNEAYTAEWLLSDSEDGAYSSVGSENTYMVKAADNGKWLKAVVSAADGSFETEPRRIREITAVTRHDGTASKIGTNETTPEEYKFTVDGMEFILLDVTEYDESKFFVMVNEKVGIRRFSYHYKHTNDSGYSAESNRQNVEIASTIVDMAAFLNDKDSVNVIVGDSEVQALSGAWSYGSSGEIIGDYSYGTAPQIGYSQQTKNWTFLPQDIKSHINYDMYWSCEPHSSAFGGEIFAVQGGIMLPSHSEVERYADRIGLWEYYDTSGTAQKLATSWWTRSTSGNASAYSVEWDILGKTTNRAGHTNGNAGCGVRPVFYLDRDFFLDVELDSALVGEEVKKAIRETYSKGEMYADGQYTKLQLERDWGYGSDLSVEANYSLSEGTVSVNTEIDCEMGSYTDFIILYTVYNTEGHLIAADMQKNSISEGKTILADVQIFENVSDIGEVNVAMLDGEGFWPLIKQTTAVTE